MANWRELKRLKERYSLLEEWYGADFAMTEFSAASHTPQAKSIADLLPDARVYEKPTFGSLAALFRRRCAIHG